MRIVVFGGGLQGRAIAADLAARSDVKEVHVADVRPVEGLVDKAMAVNSDALEPASVRQAVRDADAAIVALPGSIGKRALQNVLATGVPVVDISFSAETLEDLKDDALRSGSCAVVDCGIAPGLSHVLAGAAHQRLGGLDRLRILVGGIPKDPPPGFLHAVYFNAEDLIDEYIRPARMVVDGRFEAPNPLDAPVERHEDPELGVFDAFPSDGLRSLIRSFPDVPHMAELTLRRPGHLDVMRTLRAVGFFDSHLLVMGEEPPMRGTARILAHRFNGDEHPDFLLMVVEAERGGRRVAWRLYDERRDGVSAMSRTTGYTAASVAALLARRRFTEPGLHVPERLGEEPALVEAVLADLRERGIRIDERAS